MNRQQAISQVLLYEQLAAKAKAKAAQFRDRLTQEARAELESQGTAPTWRLQDVGTVSLPVSQEAVYVQDETALLRWIRAQPMAESSVWIESAVEVVERVRPRFVEALVADAIAVAEENCAVNPDTGEAIPGLAVRPGGLPKALSFRPTKEAQQFAGEFADKLLAEFEQHIGGPLADEASHRCAYHECGEMVGPGRVYCGGHQ